MYNFLTVLDLPGLFFCCIMGEMDAFVRDIFQNDLTKYYGGGVFYSMRVNDLQFENEILVLRFK